MSTAPRLVCLALVAALVSAAPARASFHLWSIKEIFSNADGSVQFIELFAFSSGQQFLASHVMSATSDGVTVNYTFDADLSTPPSTANRHFLAATAGFGALPGGVTPNYIIPANFFNPNAANISIDFAGFDTLSIAGSTLPKDGVNSLTDSNLTFGGGDVMSAGVNSPTNFAGATGSVNLGGPTFDAGDFDEDGSVDADDLATWRTGFGMEGAAVDHGDGDANDDHDVDGGDFLTWQQQLGASSVGAAHAVPEPTSAVLVAATLLAGSAQRRASKQIR